jgi:hypothetical protein
VSDDTLPTEIHHEVHCETHAKNDNVEKSSSYNFPTVSQVIYNRFLLLSIIDFMPADHRYKFMQTSTEHRDIALEHFIRDYISHIKKGEKIPDDLSQIPVCRMTNVSDNIRTFIKSHIPSFISLKKPLPPLFQNYFVQVSAQDLLGNLDCISPRILCFMDQCMLNYRSDSSDDDNTDMVTTEMLKIADKCITRRDIEDANDVQSHHRFMIVKPAHILMSDSDSVMWEVLKKLPAMELVLDLEGFDDNLYMDILTELECNCDPSVTGRVAYTI